MKVKIASAGAAATAAVILGLRGARLWDPPSWLLVSAIVAAAALAAYSTIAAAVKEARDKRRMVEVRRGQSVLDGTLWAVVDLLAERRGQLTPEQLAALPPEQAAAFLALDRRDLAISVWALRRRRPALLRRGKVLVPLHRLRTLRRQAATSVTWRPGKGVIGACVKDKAPKVADLDAIDVALGDVSEVVWKELPDDVTFGLTWAERVDARGKYHVVVAVPVFDHNSPASPVLGCVALDGPAGSRAALDDEDVQELLATAGQTLLQPDA